MSETTNKSTIPPILSGKSELEVFDFTKFKRKLLCSSSISLNIEKPKEDASSLKEEIETRKEEFTQVASSDMTNNPNCLTKVYVPPGRSFESLT